MEQFALHREKLLRALDDLSQRKMLAFGFLTIERMLPCLKRLSAMGGGFKIGGFVDARDIEWQALSVVIERDEVLRLRAAIAEFPSSDDYDPALDWSMALSAASAMDCLIDFIEDGNPLNIVLISECATDGIYICSNAGETPDVVTDADRRIAYNTPTMLAEYQNQDDDIKFLRSLPEDFSPRILLDRAKHQRFILPQCQGFTFPDPRF
jgi:hypothetical protein